ncbi:MAG: hypothetical protein KKD18_05370 [Nanoarchaeota archaeon]|nr:hypothetical protein [Nanoarchaeota archaeon]MBU0977820.1 hypothetical protein [Nanoarchaeota archaeon]
MEPIEGTVDALSAYVGRVVMGVHRARVDGSPDLKPCSVNVGVVIKGVNDSLWIEGHYLRLCRGGNNQTVHRIFGAEYVGVFPLRQVAVPDNRTDYYDFPSDVFSRDVMKSILARKPVVID